MLRFCTRRVADLEDDLEACIIRIMNLERELTDLNSKLFEYDARLQVLGSKKGVDYGYRLGTDKKERRQSVG